MAGAGLVPRAIVLALGAGALGGPEALRLLLQFAGRRPAVDVAISVVVISLLTAPLLGTMLLARFVRKVRAGGGGTPATDLFAQVTATVAVGVALLVTGCLLLAVPGGGLGAVRLPIDYAVNNPVAVTVLTICAAFAATGTLTCAVPLLRFLRGAAANAGDGAAPAAARASERFSRTRQAACFVFGAMLIAAVSCAAPVGLDAQRLFPGFPWRSPNTDVAVGVAIATVAGTTLVVRFSRRVRNAVGGAAAPTRATSTWRRRFGKLTSLAGVDGALMAYAHSQSGNESDGGEHANSA